MYVCMYTHVCIHIYLIAFKPFLKKCDVIKVYNLKAYLEFHPGGEKILRSVYGKDATELFIKNHRWVNYENLLEKLFVGYVEN